MTEIACSCNAMVISPVEEEMAKRTGLDPEYIHAFMDTWADIAVEILD